MKFERLKEIADLIHKYLPQCKTIGCFARVTDINLKTDDELNTLHKLGYDSITMGVEPGDEEILKFMNKGYSAEETELEKLAELKTLIGNLNIPVFFATLGASNAIFVQGQLTNEKAKMVTYLEKMCKTQNESELRHYRTHLKHL